MFISCTRYICHRHKAGWQFTFDCHFLPFSSSFFFWWRHWPIEAFCHCLGAGSGSFFRLILFDWWRTLAYRCFLSLFWSWLWLHGNQVGTNVDWCSNNCRRHVPTVPGIMLSFLGMCFSLWILGFVGEAVTVVNAGVPEYLPVLSREPMSFHSLDNSPLSQCNFINVPKSSASLPQASFECFLDERMFFLSLVFSNVFQLWYLITNLTSKHKIWS